MMYRKKSENRPECVMEEKKTMLKKKRNVGTYITEMHNTFYPLIRCVQYSYLFINSLY